MIAPAATAAAQDVRYTPADSQGRYNYLITFSEPGMLAEQRQRAPGRRFDADSPAATAYRDQLRSQQAAHIRDISGGIGREFEISHHFFVFESAVGARLTEHEAKRAGSLPGVTSVERERIYELDTFRGPEFIGAGGIWDGSAVPNLSGTLGEGMVAAVLDTGIDSTHPSFQNDPACGHGGANPEKLLSALDCSSTDGTGLCDGPDSSDWHDHGSHTASTTAGNALDTSAVPAPELPISGVAPCASIRAYRVCTPVTGGCPGFDIQAGMDSVLIHGDVDVMNFSISGGTSPWLDNDRRKLDLVEEGIFVAASAGNTSAQVPNPVGQVNHRGPWVMSVASSTHDGLIANSLSLDGGPQNEPGLQGSGSTLAADYTGDLRYAGDVDAGNFEGCNAFPANAFDGEAALISRGACNFSVKVDNATDAGADFVVVFNNAPGAPIVMGGLEGTSVSSVMVGDVVGADLVAALAGGTAQLSVEAGLSSYGDPALGDILSGFSFRGPTPPPLQDLQKPDITAPGDLIYAARPNEASGYGNMGGTSMSSPHVAGAGLLVKAVQPDWSVPEIKSAIMMTASKNGTDDDGVSPWDWDDVGSGRVDLTRAALAGLVMDETIANFLAADTNGGSIDVKELNLPAVRDMNCTPSCTWTRTVRNTLDVSTSWTVAGSSFNSGFDVEISPADFAFTGGLAETQELTITVTPVGNQTTEISFGEVVLTEIGDESPDLHFTVAIRGQGAVPPTIEVDPDSLGFLVEQDDTDTQTLTIGNLGTEDLIWSIEESEAPAGVRGGDIVVFDDINFSPNQDFTGGAVQWHTGDTCDCDTAPYNLNVYGTGDVSFFWPDLGDRGGVSLDGGATVAVLQPGDAVGPGNDYNFGTGAAPAANWRDAGGVDGYLGFRFENPDQGGAVNYGYARITTTGETGFPVTIVGWAYNQAGDPITIPEEGEPASCEDVTDIPWLSVSPDSGTTGGPGSDDVDVTVDSTGMALGDYEARLCIASNDPANPIVLVPVSLTVTDEIVEPPVIEVDPASFSVTLETDDSTDEGLVISNVGDSLLNWEFVEDAGRITRAFGPATLPHTTVPAGAASLSGAIGTSGRAAYEFPAVPRGATTITHSSSLDIVAQNAVACSPDQGVTTSANQFLRTFTLSDFGIDDDFHVDEVVFGIENLSATASITVNLYTLDGAFTYANLTQIGSATESLASQTLSLVTVPVTGTAPAGSTLVVEIEAPDLSGTAAFFPGSNSDGETAPSYIAASGCGLDDPSAFADIGFPQVQLVMTVTGQVEGVGCTMPEWVSVDPVSGSTNAGDSSNVQVTFDAGGLAEGVYEGSLCISSNDPADSLLAIPLGLTVTESQPEPGELAVTPAALAFGEVAIGGSSAMNFEVSNAAEAGAESLTLSEIDRTGDAEFQITGGDCAVGTELESGESCTVEVTFVPGGESAFTGEVTVATADGQSAAVGLSGNGVELPDDIFSDRFEEQ